MATNRVRALFPSRLPAVGMIHLGPLPGSPRFGGDLDLVTEQAARDVKVLLEERVDALLVENFGDAPFYPDEVPGITVAAMSCVIDRLRRGAARMVPWGVNVLRNDARAALAIATTVDADFIRVNVLSGAVVTDQGVIQGRAHEVARLRAAWRPQIAILADVAVKHARSLGPRPLGDEIADLVARAGADGILITGERTGRPPSLERLTEARAALGRPNAKTPPLWIASGMGARELAATVPMAEGWIVGTSLKRGGAVEAPVDRARLASTGAPARGLRAAAPGLSLIHI